MPGHLTGLAPRNEALLRAARIKAMQDFLKSQKPSLPETLYGGADDPTLSGEQNADLRRTATRRGAFQGLIESQRGGSLLSSIGAAGAAGIDFRDAANRRASLSQAQNAEPEDDVETQVVELIRDGVKHRVLIDKRTGAEIADLGVSEEQDPDLHAPVKVRLANGDERFAVFDAKRGVFLSLNGEILPDVTPIPAAPGRVLIRKFFDPDTQQEYEYPADPHTGRRVGPNVLVGISEAGGKGEEKRLLADAMTRDLATLERIYAKREYEMFSFVEMKSEGSDLARMTPLVGAQIKEAIPATDAIVTAVVRAREGGRPSDKDREFFMKFIAPRVGDEPVNIKQKLERIRFLIIDFRNDPSGAFDRTVDLAKGVNPYSSAFDGDDGGE